MDFSRQNIAKTRSLRLKVLAILKKIHLPISCVYLYEKMSIEQISFEYFETMTRFTIERPTTMLYQSM